MLNPVRAGMVRRPDEWRWSSYRPTAGEESAPPFLETDWLLGAFADTREEAVAGYRRFAADGIGAPSPLLELKNQICLGSEQFVERMQGLIDPARPLQEIPAYQRRPVAKPLEHYAAQYAERDRAIAAAYRTGSYSMQAVAEHFKVGRMTVSRAVKRHETEFLDLTGDGRPDPICDPI